jgi:hypothetical protein
MQAAVACEWVDEATGVGVQATSSELVRGLAMIAVGRVGSSGQQWAGRLVEAGPGARRRVVGLCPLPLRGKHTNATPLRLACLSPWTYLYYSTVHGPTLLPLSLTLLAARCSLLTARCTLPSCTTPSSIRSAP